MLPTGQGMMVDVLRIRDIDMQPLRQFLAEQNLTLITVADDTDIPGSHWGDDEAGLIAGKLYTRSDTPLHSVLHEACHFFLMDASRRDALHTDAGGTAVEENAVCYLQIRLADRFEAIGSQRMCEDMDRWGYSFRLGSASAWFSDDADDAVQFLREGNFWEHFRL